MGTYIIINLSSSLTSVSSAVQIIPAQVSTPTTIKVLKQSRGPRTPRISGEERSSPGNRTGTTQPFYEDFFSFFFLQIQKQSHQ